MRFKVLVSIQSDNYYKDIDSFRYDVPLSKENLWRAEFEAILLGNGEPRNGNQNPNEEFLVERISDKKIITVKYSQLSNFVLVDDGGGGGGEGSDVEGGIHTHTSDGTLSEVITIPFTKSDITSFVVQAINEEAINAGLQKIELSNGELVVQIVQAEQGAELKYSYLLK